MIVDVPAESRSAKLLGPLWPKALEHIKATLTAMLGNNAQCELLVVDDASVICHLSAAPNRIVISTGQIVRAAVISNVIAQKISNRDAQGTPPKLDPEHFNDLQPDELRQLNIHLVDPHWFDDMNPEGLRGNIAKRQPPPGMAPAFGDVSEPEDLWNWAEQKLNQPPIGAAADFYETICLFALAFLVAHEAAHLIFDHLILHKKILEEDPDYCENDQKCVEIHADREAIQAFVSGVFRAMERIDEETIALTIERLALTGVGILVGLSFGHHTMRGLRTYDAPVSDATFLARKYPHPSVRFALIESFLFSFISQIAPDLSDLAMRSFRSAAAVAIYALNGWYLSEAKTAGKGDWAVPHPFSLVMSQEANYPTKTAEEFWERHLPAYFTRHFQAQPMQ